MIFPVFIMVNYGGLKMITRRKLIAVFLIFIIIFITPASASKMDEIQKEGEYIDNYTHNGGWYKFCHFFDFCASVFKIAVLANSAKDEMNAYKNHAEKLKLESEKTTMNYRKKRIN